MLALPSALAKTGLSAGIPLMLLYGILSTWTIHNVTALYVAMKRAKVRFMVARTRSSKHWDVLSIMNYKI